MPSTSLDQMRRRIKDCLRAGGFDPKRSVFVRTDPEVIQVIGLQRSTGSTEGRLIFTVNIGVTSARLAAKLGQEMKSSVIDAHLTYRIADFLPDSAEDRWWSVETEREALAAATEVCTAMRDHALPALETARDTAGFVKWVRERGALNLGHKRREWYLELLSS